MTENLQHQSATQPEEHAKAQASAEEKAASGTGDGYTWKAGVEVQRKVLPTLWFHQTWLAGKWTLLKGDFPIETSIHRVFSRQPCLITRG